jgi:hypothetical protein
MSPLEVGAEAFILALKFIESRLEDDDERSIAMKEASRRLQDGQLMALRADAQAMLDARRKR